MNRNDALILVRIRRSVEDGSARSTRRAAGLSQAEVATVCGVTPSAVARWENGNRRPRGRAAIAYGRLLEELAK